VAVYDSLPYKGSSGWMVFGGTSAAAPIVAAFDALLGSGAGRPSYPYSHTGSYYDVTSGSNGHCQGSYLCTAVPGFDGPTGLGTPKGSGGGTANQPPNASLTASPNPANTGDSVTFNAGGSTDPENGPLTYDYDLDGNGTYEIINGGSSQTRSYATAQSFTAHVRVIDDKGATATASRAVTINSTGPQANQPPTASFTVTPAQPQTGQSTSFDGTGSKDPDGSITNYAWTFGDGASASGATPSHPYAAQGSYTVTLTVTDNQGGKGTVQKTIQVVAPAIATGPGSTPPPPPPPTTTGTDPIGTAPVGTTADTSRPVVSLMRLSATTFAAALRGSSAVAARVVGTRVSYRLSEAAVTTFRVERALPGRRVRGRCVRPTRTNASARHCTRVVLLRGYFVRTGRAGANAFRFTGRLAGRRLVPGVYWLVARAADRAGNRSVIKRVRFRIVR
jgi:PKD repeat protein